MLRDLLALKTISDPSTSTLRLVEGLALTTILSLIFSAIHLLLSLTRLLESLTSALRFFSLILLSEAWISSNLRLAVKGRWFLRAIIRL